MSVTFNIHVTLTTPQEFDELRKLYEEMRSYYDIHQPKQDYMVDIYNAGEPDQGFVAEGLRVNRKDWRVQFTRGTPESIDTSERKDE